MPKEQVVDPRFIVACPQMYNICGSGMKSIFLIENA